MPPQLETLKGNHEKASEELHDRREHMGELQQLYDAAVDELTEARKGVIRMEQEVAKARHARDVQREETKVNLSPPAPSVLPRPGSIASASGRTARPRGRQLLIPAVCGSCRGFQGTRRSEPKIICRSHTHY